METTKTLCNSLTCCLTGCFRKVEWGAQRWKPGSRSTSRSCKSRGSWSGLQLGAALEEGTSWFSALSRLAFVCGAICIKYVSSPTMRVSILPQLLVHSCFVSGLLINSTCHSWTSNIWREVYSKFRLSGYQGRKSARCLAVCSGFCERSCF